MTDKIKEALEALEEIKRVPLRNYELIRHAILNIIDSNDLYNERNVLQSQEWQPIESYVKAPHHVMVYTKNGAMMFATMYDHIWYGSGTSGVSKVRLQDEWTPTHFMPLPQPPKKGGG